MHIKCRSILISKHIYDFKDALYSWVWGKRWTLFLCESPLLPDKVKRQNVFFGNLQYFMSLNRIDVFTGHSALITKSIRLKIKIFCFIIVCCYSFHQQPMKSTALDTHILKNQTLCSMWNMAFRKSGVMEIMLPNIYYKSCLEATVFSFSSFTNATCIGGHVKLLNKSSLPSIVSR